MLKVTRCEFVHNLPCEQVGNRLTELLTDNAKLRELVRDMWDFISKAERMQWPEIHDRMRELGVEVEQ